MTLPLSRARVLAALKRLSPPWPSTEDDTSVGKELGSIASALSMVADPLDGALDEVFPDTTVQLIDRWEKVTRNPVRTTDDIATRRARVLAVLRRTSGPRVAQLEQMLAGPLDCDATDLLFIEMTRAFIEEGLTQIDSTVRTLSASATKVVMGKPWPGVVDDTGVRLYVKLSAVHTPTVTLTSPAGTVWTVPIDSAAAWYETREKFAGEHAGGRWIVTATDAAGEDLDEVRLLVSNDVDSAQIYNFFCFRDPDIAGTPDVNESQRLFRRTALAHMNAHVIERMAFIAGDAHSLCDRDPVGV